MTSYILGKMRQHWWHYGITKQKCVKTTDFLCSLIKIIQQMRLYQTFWCNPAQTSLLTYGLKYKVQILVVQVSITL